MNDIDYSRAFAPAPDRFNRRIEQTLAHLEERSMRKIPIKAVLIAAVILILLTGAALALTYHWGVLDFLRTHSTEPISAVRALVESDLNASPVTLGDATFTLTDAAYDGERVFVAVHVQSKGLPVQGEAWGDPGSLKPGEPVLTAGLGTLTSDGRVVECDSIDWLYAGDGTDLYAEYRYGEGGAPEIAIDLQVSLIDEHYTARKTGALAFRLPTTAQSRIFHAKTPIPLDGVTITRLVVKCTPFRLYTDVTYKIDPKLGKFDQMRRQYMAFDLFDERGEQLHGGGGNSGEGKGGAWFMHDEWLLESSTPRALTLKLIGQDSDPYGEYTMELGGENP
jgi:hypothetical protein